MRKWSYLLLAFVIVLLSSCSKSDESDQIITADLSEAQAYEMLMEDIAALVEENEFVKVDQIDGKTALDYYKEWELTTNSRMSSACSTPPPCNVIPFNNVFNFGGCDIAYSFDLYYCSPGNAAIYNFQMAPVAGSNCTTTYDFLITDNYNDGDLMQYQQGYNLIASVILNDIEANLFNFIPALGPQTLIATYMPNICVARCQNTNSDIVEKECGQDCCIRLAVYNWNTKSKTVDVFSAGECGGTTFTCNDGQTVDCQNLNCIGLDL